MPFSKDDKVNEVATATVKQLQTVFGKHTGQRPAHAKGILISGTFSPTAEAKDLSKAPHFQKQVPIAVRFSNSTGLPQIPDADPNSNPKGMAVRFFLGNDRKHTDIVSHSSPLFPVNNGPDFLAFLQAIVGGTAQDFLSSHPKTLEFATSPKPTPKSFATEAYYGINAFKLINEEGKVTFIRYRFVPEAGVQTYEDSEVQAKSPDFLQDEIKERLGSGTASFSLVAQIADDGDQTNDAQVRWPEERKIVKLGTLTLEKVVEDSAELQRTMILDPIPRVDGIEVSDDPLLDFRASVYLTSGKERREAGGYHPENLPRFVPEVAGVVH